LKTSTRPRVDHDDAVNGSVNHRAPARFGDARRLIAWRRT